jgi:predicted metal-binding membrane protein
MALYTAVYVGAWALFGAAALGIDHLLRAHLGLSGRVLLAVTLAAAAGWQLTRAKRRALFACGRTVPLPPFGRSADAACARYALLHARRCIQSCWALMLVMVAVGHSSLAWMVALTALVVAEELTVRGRSLTRPAAPALLLAAAAVTLGA